MNLKINNFAIIIGTMKGGTTSLFYYLSEHPQIAACTEKEPGFFSDEPQFSKGMSWYQLLWQWKPEHRIALEASTNYTKQPYFPNVAKRIAQFKDSEFRFIYIMRHPFARIESHITQQLQEKFASPQEEVQIEEEHIAFSQYAMQLDAYARIFGRDKLHVLLLEDLQNDPQTELRLICQFLKIDSDYQFKNIDVVRNSRETLNLHPMLQRVRHRSLVKPLVNLIPPRLRQELRKPLSRQDPLDIKLSKKAQAIVLKHLQPDLARLQGEYGVDVQGKWGLPIASGVKNL